VEYKPLPISCTIKPSFVHGLGLFATREIKKDTELGISHIEVDDVLYRLPLGAFINHSETSNCVRVKVNNKWYLKTIIDIMPDQELTLTYRLYKPE
jgi:SET domain-containing protein|tara:strand:+ start:101 stop:388 length:288 start_codon:yes stop_codon:yes gene_type:complete